MTGVLAGLRRVLWDRNAAVVAFRDTPGNSPHYLLANMGQVGAVYGLAYDAEDDALYAAAFQRRQLLFGPGGPGAIYRIDMSTGQVRQWSTVPDAGRDLHDPRVGVPDLEAAAGAGKTSLGDIDLDPDGRTLLVTNLATRRIYRLAVPSGQVLGDFAHGAAGEAWAEDARPFGLAVRGGRLYHGVVRTAESSGRRAELIAHVYRSALDGADIHEVASFALDYRRGTMEYGFTKTNLSLDWRPWTDEPKRVPFDKWEVLMHPMPLLADIEFDAGANLVLGLRDRLVDYAISAPSLKVSDPGGLGAGDILFGTPGGAAWSVDPSREHFRDGVDYSDQSSMGGLAAFLPAASLVPADTNGVGDIFVRDLVAGVTVRASVSTAGLEANRDNGNELWRGLSISADGLAVAWASQADNLAPGDTNGVRDVFLRAPCAAPPSV